MFRRVLMATIAGGLLAAPLAARAHPAGGMPRIGLLSPASAAAGLPNLHALQAGVAFIGPEYGKRLELLGGRAPWVPSSSPTGSGAPTPS
jgi:hypothetical protein